MSKVAGHWSHVKIGLLEAVSLIFADRSAVLSACRSLLVSSLVMLVSHWNNCGVYACRIIIFGAGFLGVWVLYLG